MKSVMSDLNQQKLFNKSKILRSNSAHKVCRLIHTMNDSFDLNETVDLGEEKVRTYLNEVSILNVQKWNKFRNLCQRRRLKLEIVVR